jgi:hypothetical protein
LIRGRWAYRHPSLIRGAGFVLSLRIAARCFHAFDRCVLSFHVRLPFSYMGVTLVELALFAALPEASKHLATSLPQASARVVMLTFSMFETVCVSAPLVLVARSLPGCFAGVRIVACLLTFVVVPREASKSFAMSRALISLIVCMALCVYMSVPVSPQASAKVVMLTFSMFETVCVSAPLVLVARSLPGCCAGVRILACLLTFVVVPREASK